MTYTEAKAATTGLFSMAHAIQFGVMLVTVTSFAFMIKAQGEATAKEVEEVAEDQSRHLVDHGVLNGRVRGLEVDAARTEQRAISIQGDVEEIKDDVKEIKRLIQQLPRTNIGVPTP